MEIVSRETRYEGPVYKSDRIVFEREDGKHITRDLVVKRPAAVVILHNVEKDTVVLCKEFRTGTMAEDLGIIAGVVDEGEASGLAALREVAEETGYHRILSQQYLGFGWASPGFTNEKIHYYYATVEGERGEQKLDHDEQIEVVEVPFKELPEMFKDGRIASQHAKSCFLHLMLSGLFEFNNIED